jgi:hypothetical protein
LPQKKRQHKKEKDLPNITEINMEGITEVPLASGFLIQIILEKPLWNVSWKMIQKAYRSNKYLS